MIFIEIIKWSLIIGAIFFSFYLYNSENQKISKLNKLIKDRAMVTSFRQASQRKMLLMLVVFACFIVWTMSYDFLVEEVKKENNDLTLELDEASKIYENLTESQIRLLKASGTKEFSDDIKEYYGEVLKNYYVMKKCNLTGRDDVFIINTAMTREMWLNNVSLKLREEIIKDSKTEFSKDFINFDCADIKGTHEKIITNYQNYILATREVLKGTF